eukprot:m.854248 g.854248  ORF g.854248 m.854248 type:complete len:64 (-) comp23503_c0_seq4:133-324(-)
MCIVAGHPHPYPNHFSMLQVMQTRRPDALAVSYGDHHLQLLLLTPPRTLSLSVSIKNSYTQCF